MTNSNDKGARRERELVNRLDAMGFAVMKAPASGSATARELPDVLAGNGALFLAIEAKSSSGDPIYIDAAEIRGLIYFADCFGARDAVAVRFDREDWYLFQPHDLYRTDAGTARVKKETAIQDGTPLDALVAPDVGDDGREGVPA